MEGWLESVQAVPLDPPSLPGNRRSRGSRLVRAAWRLTRQDSALPQLGLLLSGSTALVTAAMVAVLSHLHGAPGAHRGSQVLLIFLVSTVAIAFAATVFLAAMAHAADCAFDGMPLSLSEAVAEGWQSRRDLLLWSLVASAIFVAFELLSATGTSGRVLGALAFAAWSFLSAFAVPIMALEAATPGEAIAESAAIARRRWGEELGGLFAIGFVTAVVVFLFLMVYVPGLQAFRNHHHAGPAIAMAIGGLGGLITLFYAAATAQAFTVALLRLDGGRSQLDELERKPSADEARPARLRLLRLALGTAVVVGLVALIATQGVAEPVKSYTTSLPSAEASGIAPGAPIVYEGDRVGEVDAVQPLGAETIISFEVEGSLDSAAFGRPLYPDVFEDRPCLRIGGGPPQRNGAGALDLS